MSIIPHTAQDECIVRITEIGAEYDIEICLIAYLSAFLGTCSAELHLNHNETREKLMNYMSRIDKRS